MTARSDAVGSEGGRLDAAEAGSAVTPERERTQFGGVAAFAVAVALVAFGGLPGVAGAALVVGTWYLLGPTFAFAAGHVAVVSLLGEAPLLAVGGIEVGLLAVLLSPATGLDAPLGPVLVALASLALGGGAAWATARGVVGPTLAAAALTATLLLAGYGLHRWQLVDLGLVSSADESERATATGTAGGPGGETDVQ